MSDASQDAELCSRDMLRYDLSSLQEDDGINLSVDHERRSAYFTETRPEIDSSLRCLLAH